MQKRHRKTDGCLETEGSEVQMREVGIPVRDRDGVHVACNRRADRTGVRAFVGAMKSRNGDGAKGRRKVDA